MARKYYWLKLIENFFEREEIKVIEAMPNGEKYIIFYLKLLLKSISMEGKLMFRNIIPYTVEMISSVTNTDVDTVRVAIDLFERLGLMEKLDDGALFMMETRNMIGSETEWAKKKREQRSKKLLTEDNVPQLSEKCPTELELEKELELDIELEKEVVLSSTTTTSPSILSHFVKNFNRKPYEAEEKILLEFENKIGIDLVNAAIDECVLTAKDPSMYYTKAIMARWYKEGIKTLTDIEADRIAREKKKSVSSENKKIVENSFNSYPGQRKYDMDEVRRGLSNTPLNREGE